MTNAKIVLSKITHFNWAKPFHASMGRVDAWQKACAIFLLCAATAIASSAQTFSTLFNFNGTNGAYPGVSSLVEGTDGNFYGTTAAGGTSSKCTVTGGCGTFFEITPEGMLSTLYSFCSQTSCADGIGPGGALVLGTDGNFYGTPPSGGVPTDGTVFNITPTGTLTTLHTFDGTDGIDPRGALALGTDGSFYGTTAAGGTGSRCTVTGGCGTVFE